MEGHKQTEFELSGSQLKISDSKLSQLETETRKRITLDAIKSGDLELYARQVMSEEVSVQLREELRTIVRKWLSR